MSELAFNLNGEPFDLPLTAPAGACASSRARVPEVVYGREGAPLVLRIDADTADLRREARSEGRYRLDAIDENNRPIAGAPPAYVCIHPRLPERGWHIMRRLRYPRCDVRRQPVEADAVDGPQADRRDDALRPVRGGPHAARARDDPRSRPRE
jgi:hypothetical protein